MVTYLVCASDEPEKKIEDDWYLQALEVLLESCDWILAKPDPQSYYVHWSG
jgi:hypothetical protein